MGTDLSRFKRDSGFYKNVELLVSVKSFKLNEIRERYLASKQRNDGVTGSVERREPSEGGVIFLSLNNGLIFKEKTLEKLIEPRGIAYSNGVLAIASDKTVFVFDQNGKRTLQHPWFCYIHTLDFSPESGNLLVSSSGFDAIFEFHVSDLSLKREWFAWENGFNVSRLPASSGKPIFLTRSKDEYQKLKSEGKEAQLIQNPLSQELPTAKRAAFINSAHYYSENEVLLSFFHLGKIYLLNFDSNKIEEKISGLKNPHGGRKFKSGLMATSTSDGRIVIHAEDSQIFSFNNLHGKSPDLGENEWVQNSIGIGDIVVSVDSNRTSFVVFDPAKRLYDVIPYNSNWAVQDLVNGSGFSDIKGLMDPSDHFK